MQLQRHCAGKALCSLLLYLSSFKKLLGRRTQDSNVMIIPQQVRNRECRKLIKELRG